ncbi:MAG: hypothetical protein AMXMBFR16_12370 [Candidatus Uhrbacteria bacterium]
MSSNEANLFSCRPSYYHTRLSEGSYPSEDSFRSNLTPDGRKANLSKQTTLCSYGAADNNDHPFGNTPRHFESPPLKFSRVKPPSPSRYGAPGRGGECRTYGIVAPRFPARNGIAKRARSPRKAIRITL